jgi:hypothetical protein
VELNYNIFKTVNINYEHKNFTSEDYNFVLYSFARDFNFVKMNVDKENVNFIYQNNFGNMNSVNRNNTDINYDSSRNLAKIFIKSGYSFENISRKYVKLSQVISNVSGCMMIVLYIFQFINFFYSKTSFFTKLTKDSIFLIKNIDFDGGMIRSTENAPMFKINRNNINENVVENNENNINNNNPNNDIEINNPTNTEGNNLIFARSPNKYASTVRKSRFVHIPEENITPLNKNNKPITKEKVPTSPKKSGKNLNIKNLVNNYLNGDSISNTNIHKINSNMNLVNINSETSPTKKKKKKEKKKDNIMSSTSNIKFISHFNHKENMHNINNLASSPKNQNFSNYLFSEYSQNISHYPKTPNARVNNMINKLNAGVPVLNKNSHNSLNDLNNSPKNKQISLDINPDKNDKDLNSFHILKFIKFGISDSLAAICCISFCPYLKNCNRKIKRQAKVYDFSRTYFERYLDFNKFMEKFIELDLIKQFLFNQDQLNLVNRLKNIVIIDKQNENIFETENDLDTSQNPFEYTTHKNQTNVLSKNIYNSLITNFKRNLRGKDLKITSFNSITNKLQKYYLKLFKMKERNFIEENLFNYLHKLSNTNEI